MDEEKLEQLARNIVDSWDMDTTIEYCVTNLCEYFKLNPDEAKAEALFFEGE